MKISIDATALSAQRTGTVTYVTQIVASIQRDASIDHAFVLFVTDRNRHHFDRLGLDGRFELVVAPSGTTRRLVWQQTLMIWHVWRKRVNVHWGATFILPWQVPCVSVVTIHDMTFELFPQVHQRIKRLYFPCMIRLAVKQATAVLVVSHNTAQDLVRLIPAAHPKTVVTWLAADQYQRFNKNGQNHSAPERDGASDCPSLPWPSALPAGAPFVLTVGTLEPRKNLVRLLQGWQSLSDTEKREHRLLVVGATGWLVNDIESSVGIDPTVVFAGHICDEQLSACFKSATAFVYPSLYEGFGLPVLEAMACGLPVLTSRGSSTEEVAGEAAVLVDPESVDAIRTGLARLLSDTSLRERLAQAGLRRASAFSWAETTRRTLAAIEATARSGSNRQVHEVGENSTNSVTNGVANGVANGLANGTIHGHGNDDSKGDRGA